MKNGVLCGLGLVAGLFIGCSAESSDVLLSGLGGSSKSVASLPFTWPPQKGEAYPDLELSNHRGDVVRLSSLAGKVLLIEPIGMT